MVTTRDWMNERMNERMDVTNGRMR